MELHKTIRMGGVKKFMGLTVHLEKRQGTREQARAYCMKPETRDTSVLESGPWEFGEFAEGGQGHRSDLDSVAALVQEGKTIQEIAEAYPVQYIKYSKGIEKLVGLKRKNREFADDEDCDVWLIYGPPNQGKSFFVSKRWPDAYWKNNTKWWDFYEQEEVVVFDDFYGQLPIVDFLRICDRYKYSVEVKGLMTPLAAKTIVFTSNKMPHQWWSEETKAKHQWASIERRIKHWCYIEIADDGDRVLREFQTKQGLDEYVNNIAFVDSVITNSNE